MTIRITALAVLALAVLAFASQALGAELPCEKERKAECFGLESVSASLSTAQAGAHPDLTFSFDVKKDPESKLNPAGLKQPYAATRDVRFELPPGLVGNPNVLGAPEQCTTAELFSWANPEGGGCPNGSQIGISKVALDEGGFTEPVYMMVPPGGDVVARVAIVAALYPTFINFTLRSEGDYGLTAEIVDASPQAKVSRIETTTWGVPADSSHDTERCTPLEVEQLNCVNSPKRHPGSRPLPFLTNPTRCGIPLEMRVAASSWVEPERFDTVSAPFPEIVGCNQLPYGPKLSMAPTTRRAGAPTGLDLTISLPASVGVKVLEPSQTRYLRIDLPEGMAVNPAIGDGISTCSPAQAGFEKAGPSDCPDAAKLADVEFDVPVLERRLKGAIYLREPEPGNPFRVWIVADDLGLHIKLPSDLEVDKQTGQIHSISIGTPKLEGLPQAPLREIRIELKTGFRAPLVNPPACGEYRAGYEFVPWSGGPLAKGSTDPIEIDEGCDTGRFAPKLSAGSTDASAGKHSPFLFTLTREDGEQNPASFDITLPHGLVATFAGVAHCEGADVISGHCPPDSRIGEVSAALGAGPAPLWVPQAGKRPTAVYLGGPYKGTPTSIVAVVPRQAGPFDFGDEVVRSAIEVDPVTAQATAKTDPLPQIVEGIPLTYRTLYVAVDRPGFALNPTSCAPKVTEALVASVAGALAKPSSPFKAVDCAELGFKPSLSIRLQGGTHRGAHPKLSAVLKMPKGGANLASAQVALPSSEFIENSHFKTICTRVQFAAHKCPAGSIYGTARVRTPLLAEPLEGPVYLRSSDHQLPDLVMALKGPPSLPVEIDAVGRVDSANGGLRTTFESIPDAPVTEFTLQMHGASKGLIVNSRNLCNTVNRATAKFTGQNGKRVTLHPALKASCGGGTEKRKR